MEASEPGIRRVVDTESAADVVAKLSEEAKGAIPVPLVNLARPPLESLELEELDSASLDRTFSKMEDKMPRLTSDSALFRPDSMAEAVAVVAGGVEYSNGGSGKSAPTLRSPPADVDEDESGGGG